MEGRRREEADCSLTGRGEEERGEGRNGRERVDRAGRGREESDSERVYKAGKGKGRE